MSVMLWLYLSSLSFSWMLVDLFTRPGGIGLWARMCDPYQSFLHSEEMLIQLKYSILYCRNSWHQVLL